MIRASSEKCVIVPIVAVALPPVPFCLSSGDLFVSPFVSSFFVQIPIDCLTALRRSLRVSTNRW